MADNDADDPVIANPTYMADIRHFFTDDDIEHMAAKSIDLGTYEGVKAQATNIYTQTQAGAMPPPPPDSDEPPWSDNKVQTFVNWMATGYPRGSATAAAPAPSIPDDATAGRVRKNVASLSDEEVETLKAAFTGIMGRPAADPNSYYALAGIHWYPGGWDGVVGQCQHHVNPFIGWHRVYLKVFEDALRSVRDCENVTLPYWDVSTRLPQLLQEQPFASYTLPEDPAAHVHPNPGYFPGATDRYLPDQITANMTANSVVDDLNWSLKQSLWGKFGRGGSGYQQSSIQAHDGGHDAIGEWMANQDVSAFDPVFWFFHCNLDRLWLKWQQLVGATTLTGFKSTLGTNTGWLSPPLNGLPPFSPPALTPATTTDETIAYAIMYEDPEPDSAEDVTLENTTGSIAAARSFSIKSSTPVSVRVKDIDRLNIPGSFVVKLLADGEVIARRALFQPTSPRECATCRSESLISLDFRIDQEKLLDRQLSVEIEVPRHKDIGAKFPLSQAGNPTINARLLLHDE